MGEVLRMPGSQPEPSRVEVDRAIYESQIMMDCLKVECEDCPIANLYHGLIALIQEGNLSDEQVDEAAKRIGFWPWISARSLDSDIKHHRREENDCQGNPYRAYGALQCSAYKDPAYEKHIRDSRTKVYEELATLRSGQNNRKSKWLRIFTH